MLGCVLCGAKWNVSEMKTKRRSEGWLILSVSKSCFDVQDDSCTALNLLYGSWCRRVFFREFGVERRGEGDPMVVAV